jgi:predicted ATP-grasp superfamily ATP-dependent carboligase
MRVLVTDGDNRAALAVTRSLGRAGHEVIVAEKHTPSLAQTSRYCHHGVTYPDPVSPTDDFIKALSQIVREQRIDVLVPVADITTFLVTRNRDRFNPCAIPFAPVEILERAANKVDLIQTATRLRVPVPQMVVVSYGHTVPELSFGYPVVIKPRQSRIRMPRGWVSSSVSYAASPEELRRDLAARPAHEFPVMVQERIVGPGIGVFALYRGGHPVAMFSHRRIRERPPWGGVSVLSESVPIDESSRHYATQLLDALNWHGVAMVEFKRDTRDGELKLMEINGRFWGSLQLAIDAGVDFPALLVRGVEYAGFEEPPSYRIGVRNRWLWGDFDSLLLRLVDRSDAARMMPGHRARTVFEFMKFFGPNLHYENPRLGDLSPFVFESYRWFRAAWLSLTHGRRETAVASPRMVPVS